MNNLPKIKQMSQFIYGYQPSGSIFPLVKKSSQTEPKILTNYMSTM